MLFLGTGHTGGLRAEVPGSHSADSLAQPSAPRNGGDVFKYRLHSPDGEDLGEATYAVVIEQ